MNRRNLLACCLVLAGLVGAAVAEEVYVPDITTVIEGGGLEVVDEAIPDYSATVPAPPEPAAPPAEVAAPELPPTVVELAVPKPRPQFFLEGLVAPSWPLSLFSRFSVFTAGERPFRLDVAYDTVGGYGLESAADGFFHNRSRLGISKVFASGTARLKVAGNFRSQDNGLQGQSLLFDDINRRGADASVEAVLPLGLGFALAGKIPVDWYSRYAGFSSTVGRSGVHGNVALSILRVNPEFGVNWTNAKDAALPSKHRFNASLSLGWDYAATLNPSPGSGRNRGDVELRASWLWNSRLELSAGLGLAYLPAGINTTPAGSGIYGNKLILPFFAALRWEEFADSAESTEKPWSVFVRGGLESRRISYLAREEAEPYVNFTAAQFADSSEQSDWFAEAGLNLPLPNLSASFPGAVALTAAADFRQSAFGNGVLTGNYAAGIDGWTGLFAAEVIDRTAVSARIAAEMELSDFLLTVGWKGRWLYVPAGLPPHVIFVSAGYESSAGRWGGSVAADFGIRGADNAPVLGASISFTPVENLTLRLNLQDMVKLFTGGQRIFVEPYMREGGSVSLSLQFSL